MLTPPPSSFSLVAPTTTTTIKNMLQFQHLKLKSAVFTLSLSHYFASYFASSFSITNLHIDSYQAVLSTFCWFIFQMHWNWTERPNINLTDFREQSECLAGFKNAIAPCLGSYERSVKKHPIKVAKILRLTMDTIDEVRNQLLAVNYNRL